ncbi:hypothetical protein KC343_g163 [Hortaea werneckii]|nr:hypothetical protein KC323_g3298 [Hortaea werneckii]KAI6870425.1 hypothetical protein KC338_g3023 [Hortaea werneckii]KAI7290872.1 hypothetical protein KC352_g3007 [Hortaea werneckii]KAI7572773.1 hypothetical protein KC317_g461 [Hortaea werneckii]KAI7626969.1 hypothetical protein KC346_g981 [Hortaea werneckii]
MVPRNYQEMPSQLPDSFSESSQQVGMDDMNDLLMMSERQSREAVSSPSNASTSARVGNTVPQPSGPSQRDRDMQSLINAFARGWHQGIDELLSTEYTNHNLPRQHSTQLSCQTYLMLISMEQAVFEGLLHGTLGRRYHDDPSTRRALDKLNSRVQLTSQPGIYWQSILSPDGYAPTPAQTIEVLDTIEKLYLHPVVETDAETGLRAILAIDGLNLPLTSAHEARMGLRKYVFKTNQQGKRVMSRSRIDRLQLFCRRLRKRIQCVPSEYHVRSRVHRLHPVS